MQENNDCNSNSHQLINGIVCFFCHFEQIVLTEFVPSQQQYENATQEIKEAVIIASQ